jgi:hypothetical protein
MTPNKLFFSFSQLMFVMVLLGIGSPTLSKLSNARRNEKEKESADAS